MNWSEAVALLAVCLAQKDYSFLQRNPDLGTYKPEKYKCLQRSAQVIGRQIPATPDSAYPLIRITKVPVLMVRPACTYIAIIQQ